MNPELSTSEVRVSAEAFLRREFSDCTLLPIDGAIGGPESTGYRFAYRIRCPVAGTYWEHVAAVVVGGQNGAVRLLEPDDDFYFDSRCGKVVWSHRPRPDLGEREKLLLLAACLCGHWPGDGISANCFRVLRQALEWASHYPRDMELGSDDPVVEDWYRTLIGMTRHEPLEEQLVQGHGNLGSESSPPADHHFTSCTMTYWGLKVAGHFFAQDTEKRQPLLVRWRERQERRARYREKLPPPGLLDLLRAAMTPESPADNQGLIAQCMLSDHAQLTRTPAWLNANGLAPAPFLAWLEHQGITCDCGALIALEGLIGHAASDHEEDDRLEEEDLRRRLFPSS